MTTTVKSKPATRQGGAADPGPQRIRVWDPMLRAFHWLLAILVTANWLLGQFGPAKLTLHFWFGYAILALLVFRILWGFVGPREARFASFVRGPGAVLGYARDFFSRKPSNWVGHNPMGAVSVIAMLLVLLVQVGTGLISDPDDFINVGPLADQVSRSTRSAAVGWHGLGGTVILILVLLHIGTILWYRFWKREDLVRPMLTGWKEVDGDRH